MALLPAGFAALRSTMLPVVAAAATIAASAAAPPPHIALIVSDDLGWDDVGFRSHQIRTPNIDRLARQGRVLNHYYVQDVCSPSRAAFQVTRPSALP